MGLGSLFPGGKKLVKYAHRNGALHLAAEHCVYRHGMAQTGILCCWSLALRILQGLHYR